MWTDSKSAVDLAFDPVAFKNTKHILRAATFLRDLVAREVLVLQHLPGTKMVADILTKAPSRIVFVELLRMLVEGVHHAPLASASVAAFQLDDGPPLRFV